MRNNLNALKHKPNIRGIAVPLAMASGLLLSSCGTEVRQGATKVILDCRPDSLTGTAATFDKTQAGYSEMADPARILAHAESDADLLERIDRVEIGIGDLACYDQMTGDQPRLVLTRQAVALSSLVQAGVS